VHARADARARIECSLVARRVRHSRELQAEIEELLAIETSLQNKLDETSSQLKHAQQENSQKDVQIERAKATEVKLIDREGKAKLRMQAAEAALAEAEASYSKGAMRWRVQVTAHAHALTRPLSHPALPLTHAAHSYCTPTPTPPPDRCAQDGR
jgi:chromosome segregation ATPase